MSSSLMRRRMDGGLLSRLLDDPDLAPTLRALPAPALRQLILRVGLEDAGELIALASLDQLRDVFDEDLWRSAEPGRDEVFDATRFAVWLEVLLEGGETPVADRLAGMSEDFLVFAVSQLVRVLDVELLATWAADPDEAELLDRILDVHLQQELDQFLLLSRHDAGWDAVLTALLALDQHHPQLLRGVLCRCATATHEEVGSAGMLSSVLEGEELLLEDARAEREERRAERGYVSPADARAFLSLARTAPRQPELDPVTRAHFRELQPRSVAGSGAHSADAGPSSASLRGLLLEAGAEPSDLPAVSEPPAAGTLFRQALEELLDVDPDAHRRVIEELAYLANVLIAGDTSAARAWRPVEAAERVLALCDEGLRSAIRGSEAQPSAARDALLRWGAVGAFRLAWASLAGSGRAAPG